MFTQARRGLYDPIFEHDNCGIGLVADISGRSSHDILRMGLKGLARLNHRGAMAADGRTGDGAGVLTALPKKIFGPDRAVGVLFIPGEAGPALDRITEICRSRHLEVVDVREVPTNCEVLGERARTSLPGIYHLILQGDLCDQNLYLARREIEGRVQCYIPSFSSRVVVYKGLLMAVDLADFYLDLRQPEFETSFIIFHQRFSTNTFPSWPLAQPFRMLAHNGEINTLSGNRIWSSCRESLVGSSVWGKEKQWLFPVIQPEGSDSMSLDNALEFSVHSGRDLLHSVMALIPQAWEKDPDLPPDLKAFYQYHACFQEPWDGPAAVVFTDGRKVGAALDRNGFRPLRYSLTKDGLLVATSELGVLDMDPYAVLEKGNCHPGEILGVDFEAGKFLHDWEIKEQVSRHKPYRSWLKRHLKTLPAPLVKVPKMSADELIRRQIALNYSVEEWEFILRPMAEEGKEPTGSMGDDAPLAVLSTRARPVFHHFRQRFAQVTNPPMDPLREDSVMSLQIYVGPSYDPLEECPDHARKIVLETPFLTSEELEQLKSMASPYALETCFAPSENMRQALERLKAEAERAARKGKWLLVLSDRSMAANKIPVPAPLALGCVHNHLLKLGLRGKVELVVDSAEVRDDHQFAVLIGYGAAAVCPYLVLEALEDSTEVENYRIAVLKGIRKIMSKMGICTLTGYRGAQIFEILGLSSEVVEECFQGTASPISGIGYEDIERDVRALHEAGYGQENVAELPLGGFHRYRKGEEHHFFSPQVVKWIHNIARGNTEALGRLQETLQSMPPIGLRDLLQFKKTTPIPLEEVEPVESICRRFSTAAMSLGALSPEAHETLAIAMNRIGGRSNTGEGGELRERLLTRGSEVDRNSKMKQVASARFGVTPEYLVSAEELQIKMAQGSKPGEGGQLPGHKVNELIASVRHARPGTPLISPPPHHDIYSIEDLAQLIYDLKQINPSAQVSVKLVSESGVGTIAAGVAKAGANGVLISGHDGGTGASPRGSIKHAGSPWELGLAETNQVLVLNGLRSRMRVVADGGLKSGRDVVIAALLGADGFGFGTVALIAAGCVMARACHLNTCPVGVATQNPELRKKFPGDPERVIRFLRSVAEEVRFFMAQLGLRSLDEAVGRVDLLEQRHVPDHPKANKVDLSRVLHREQVPQLTPLPQKSLKPSLRAAAEQAVTANEDLDLYFAIRNDMRTVGADLAGLIAENRLKGREFEGEIRVHFLGTAGLSFGAFCEKGIRLTLIGEANDYVGKGMGGGTLVLRPPDGVTAADTSDHCIAGNTVLYGATGGEFYASGRAGQRFAVRNSGAVAVVEGIGDHGCEYMTEGVVLILGPIGRNFGAGMTGGVSYFFGEREKVELFLNEKSVVCQELTNEDEERVRELSKRHLKLTNSSKAAGILENWSECRSQFFKVLPRAAAEAILAGEVAAASASAQTGTFSG